MRRLTMQQVNDDYGGKIPPDAVLIPEPGPSKPKATKKTAGRRTARFAVLNTFTDCGLAALTGGEVKVWLILFRDTKAATGTARTVKPTSPAGPASNRERFAGRWPRWKRKGWFASCGAAG